MYLEKVRWVALLHTTYCKLNSTPVLYHLRFIKIRLVHFFGQPLNQTFQVESASY